MNNDLVEREILQDLGIKIPPEFNILIIASNYSDIKHRVIYTYTHIDTRSYNPH
jgi:hypothetical protein